jgi:hypothetical protein
LGLRRRLLLRLLLAEARCGGLLMRGDFDEDEYDDYDDDVSCDACDGDGWILTCCDDMCHGVGYCIHGDGMAMCACNTGPGETCDEGYCWT